MSRYEWAAQFPCCVVIQSWIFTGSKFTVAERRFEQFPEFHVCRGTVVAFKVWDHFESVQAVALDTATDKVIHVHFTRQVREVSPHVN